MSNKDSLISNLFETLDRDLVERGLFLNNPYDFCFLVLELWKDGATLCETEGVLGKRLAPPRQRQHGVSTRNRYESLASEDRIVENIFSPTDIEIMQSTSHEYLQNNK